DQMWNCHVPGRGQYFHFATACESQLLTPQLVSLQAREARFVPTAHKVHHGSVFTVSEKNSRVPMRTTLKHPTPAVDSQRALQREALHELDDSRRGMLERGPH